MLRIYIGEFLISPVPVHFGMNFCSHGCWFCFSNLNQPKRRADWGSVNRFLKRNSQDRKQGLLDWLLINKYPILCANDSDPFAKSNQDGFRQSHAALSSAGCRFTYQTRGGEGASEFLSREPKTMVYVSVCSDNEEVTRANEPGATALAERLELIRLCLDHGHHVILGINPLVPAWFKDFYRFAERIAKMGITHVWYGLLHLNLTQIGNIPAPMAAKHTSEIKYARTHKKPDQSQIEAYLHALGALGINCFAFGTSCKGNFWKPYFDLGFPLFPTIEGWFDELRNAGHGKPVAFSFEDFYSWSRLEACPISASYFKEYLCAFGRSIRNIDRTYKARNFRDVLGYTWRILDYPTALRHDEIAVVMDGQEVVTDGGKDLLAYLPYSNQQLAIDISQCMRYKR